jgi:hypothetical protein
VCALAALPALLAVAAAWAGCSSARRCAPPPTTCPAVPTRTAALLDKYLALEARLEHAPIALFRIDQRRRRRRRSTRTRAGWWRRAAPAIRRTCTRTAGAQPPASAPDRNSRPSAALERALVAVSAGLQGERSGWRR